MTFVLSTFVPHLSFFGSLGKDVLRDCGALRERAYSKFENFTTEKGKVSDKKI